MRPNDTGSLCKVLFPNGRLLAAALLLLLAGSQVFGLPGASVPPPLRVPDTAGRGEVTLPVAEYRSLVGGSGGPPSAPGAKIENARFRITISGQAALFEEKFDIVVAGSGWLSLPVVRSALDQATIAPAERGAFFVARDGTRLALSGPGSAAGTLGTTVPVGTDSNGRQYFSLPLPLFAVQQGRVELPGAGLEVTVNGGELLSRSESTGPATTVLEVAVRPGANLSVAFRERNLSEKGRSAALRASATLYSRTEVVGPNVVMDVTARITATAGRIAGVAFDLPPGFQMLYLRGTGLLAAETAPGQVRAARVSASGDPLEAELRLTRPLAEGAPVELTPPRLVLDGPVDVYAELRPPAGVLVEMTAPGSFEPVEIDKLPPVLRPLAADAEEVLHLAADKAGHTEPAVYVLHRLDAAPVLVAQVRVARGLTLVSSNGRALSRIEYEVVSSVKPFLTIHLAAGSRFWGAEAMGRPILPAMPEAGSVAVPLRGGRRRIARVAVYVLSSASVPGGTGRGSRKGTLEFQPPGTDIPISTLTWTFALPAGAEYRLAGTDYHPGAGADVVAAEVATSSWQTELGRRAQEALARESSAGGRAPITPRMPELQISAIVRTELPASPPKAIRFEAKPSSRREEWQ